MPVIDIHSHDVPRGWPDLAEATGDSTPWPRLRIESEREAMILIGDREFRRITQQFAHLSIRQSGWALAYWRDLRPRCRSDSDAYRRLANRWLAIIWKMWQDGKAYDESYHLQQRALRRRPKP